jgi:hypothetical protein
MQSRIEVNGKPMPHGVWNLILSVRDVSLFTKGMRIHRHWKLRDVKHYFGVKGGKDKVLEQLEAYKGFVC